MEQLKELREKVIKANQLYNELRNVVNISDDEPFQREGIKILSEPFIKGVFTLAVIGQMSAGKSAFINALLEDEDILPTGHFQTTCTLTEIVWSTEKRLKITYGDGHIVEFYNDEISKELKSAVAINPKFDSLPINHIHDFILNGEGIDEILKHKNDIYKISRRKIDDELLKEYILGNAQENITPKTKETIPIHVYMEYPLNESYRGWRIVDTPGIGALGGIDQTTKDFLENDNVDAAIFMFNGADHIEKTDLNLMVTNAYAQLSDIAKDRTFFVITHAGDSTCRTTIDKTFKIALELFSEGDVSIPRERFFAVDSMLSLLYDCAIVRYNIDPMIFRNDEVEIEGMDEDAAEMYQSMIGMLSRELAKEKKERNTENLNKKIVEVAGFVTLKQSLGAFARDAKRQAYIKFHNTIISDFKAFSSKKSEEKELWSEKLVKSPEEFAQELEQKKSEIEKYRAKLVKEYNKIIFSYGADVLDAMFNKSIQKFKSKVNAASSLAEMDNAYNNFQDMFPIEEELVMTRFTRDCKQLGEIEISSDFPTISLPPVDIEEAKRKAKKDATTTNSKQERVKRGGLWNGIRRLLDIGGWDYVTRYYDVIDDKKQLENYRSNLLAGAKEAINVFCKDLFESYIKPTGADIQKQLDQLVDQKKKEYDAIKDALDSAQEISDKISSLEEDIQTISEYKDKVIETTNID